jgi:E3 SUMO-protein ligase PIAS1
LESTSDAVEDVIVEADGEWHTSDDKYASDAWKKTHKPVPPLVSPTPHLKHQATPNSPSGDASTQERSQRQGDVVVLDSEEEDEGEVKRELSPSRPEQFSMNGLLDTQVIDLTVESDDESTSTRSLGKRKADSDLSASGDIWKKSRLGEAPGATAVNDNVNISTSGVLASGVNHGARSYAANGTPMQHRPHSTQFTPDTQLGSYTTPYYAQPSRVAAPPFPASFGSQVSHRAGYYSQFGI